MQAAPPPSVVSCWEHLPDGRRIACRPSETLVTGCRDGEPLSYVRVLGAGAQPTSPAEFVQAREKLWRERMSYSGLCLAFAARVVGVTDPERARSLAALGFVRVRWEAVRCAAAERGGQGYRFVAGIAEAGNQLEQPTLYKPAAVWRAAVKRAAQDPASLAYAVGMAKVCGSAPVRPEAEWPALRAKLEAAIVAAADKPVDPEAPRAQPAPAREAPGS